jgi:hypothetical protein
MCLDLDHMTRGAHTGDIGNPLHESVWCPHSRGTNKDTLKWPGHQKRNLKMTGYHEQGIRYQVKDQLELNQHGYMKAIVGIFLYSYPELN